MTNKPRHIADFERVLLDQLILAADERDGDLRSRVDILERILELVRFYNGFGANSVPLREVLAAGFTMEGKLIRFGSDPAVPKNVAWPRRSFELQLPLLDFLLCSRIPEEEIFQTIERFVQKIHPILGPLDFERTKTGVRRCHTNTRFAAMDLRRFGLLKVTDQELFKVWELSFVGVVVAVSSHNDCVQGKTGHYWNYLGKAESRLNGGIYQFLYSDSFLSKAESVVTDILSNNPDLPAVELTRLRALLAKYHAVFLDQKPGAELSRAAATISDEIERLPGMAQRLASVVNGKASRMQFDPFLKAFGQILN